MATAYFDGIGRGRRREVAVALAMGAHRRLGAGSPVRLLGGHCRDIVGHVLAQLPLFVPDDVETLADALDTAAHGSGQVIVLRAGEHTVGARRGEVAAHGVLGARVGHTVLHLRGSHFARRRPVAHHGARDAGVDDGCALIQIVGEKGASLKGQLVLEGGTRGSVRGLLLQDAGDCCVRMEGDARWTFRDCHFVCGHACALRVEVQAEAVLERCSLGGEGHVGVASVYHAYGSLQERGLAKHACYGLFVSGRAALLARSCEVRFCSEAALFIAGAARARLLGCTIGQCRTLFFSGVGCGAELRLGGCKLAPSSGGRFWADEDRPAQLTISVREDGGGGADSDSDDDEFAAARCIGCMQPAALCACEC